jgi:hypothetical protein
MSEWTHTVCEVCWFKRNSPLTFGLTVTYADEDDTNAEPQVDIRWPHQVIVSGVRAVDLCCLCGSPKITKIYVRIDPTSPALLCNKIEAGMEKYHESVGIWKEESDAHA